jgi:hypothetical protein
MTFGNPFSVPDAGNLTVRSRNVNSNDGVGFDFHKNLRRNNTADFDHAGGGMSTTFGGWSFSSFSRHLPREMNLVLIL